MYITTISSLFSRIHIVPRISKRFRQAHSHPVFVPSRVFPHPALFTRIYLYTTVAKCRPVRLYHGPVLLMAPPEGKPNSHSRIISFPIPFNRLLQFLISSQQHSLTTSSHSSAQSTPTSTSHQTKNIKSSLSSQRIASYLTDFVNWNPQYQHTAASVHAHTERMKAYLEEFDKKMALSPKK
jgi:hypothetical protein